MRSFVYSLLLISLSASLSAQPNHPATKQSPVAQGAAAGHAQSEPYELPVRKVVLYKNGVGYFEHAGKVNGNQRVAIDFSSSQLNDVLQSLTVLDEGGGRIADVDYNSTTPLDQQLKTLAIGLNAETTISKFFEAMRGARVEVRTGGGTFAGRIMDIEEHKTGAGKDNDGMTEVRFLTVVSDSGEVRIFPVTPAVDVRLVDAGLEGDVNRYLELLNSARSTGLRHLTLDALGTGERTLEVSYISAVPVWKSTYRIVFPREANGNATVQGWAVVDNTVGADWDNVQLSLVAGAPQSFIQPLSEPLYVQRPEIPIATAPQIVPETHEAAERMNNELTGRNPVSVMAESAPPPAPVARSLGVAGMVGLGGGVGYGSNTGGGMYRPTDAFEPGAVTTSAFDDYFEYALKEPVTIRKNESAMVPILEQSLPAEHVTLWSDASNMPLRALWLTNASKLTLDAGSFSIFENGEFAGEGLLDPIHPGEKRLISYAVDQAVKVNHGGYANTRFLRHIAMHNGLMVETSTEIHESTYTVTNQAEEPRLVIVEHTRWANAELDSDPKPAETTATKYRFRVEVQPHESVDLHVGEEAKRSEHIVIQPDDDRSEFLITVSKYSPELEEKLRPLTEAETALSDLRRKTAENEEKQKELADDEARYRDNLTALKGDPAAKRFVDELNSTEDALLAAQKEQVDLKSDEDKAQARLETVIGQMSFDEDVDARTESIQYGNRPPRP